MRTYLPLAAVLFSSAFLAAQAAPADIPDALKPPATVKLILQAHATGAQIYTCNAAADGKFAWTLKGPEADLRDTTGKMIISHSAGPKWQHRDGSMVTGKVAAKQSAPDASAIPWLLLDADNSNSNKGVLSAVTYVQRVHTEGGQPPAMGCDEAHKGAESRANYSADYLFYAPGH